MEKNIIFYDGHCGLCHTWVKFVVHFDKKEIFYFSPLQGQTINKTLTAEVREGLPDSIVVVNKNGAVFLKAKAVGFILSELGGIWSLFYWVLTLFPEKLKNLTYDQIAKIRKKIFGERQEVCPILPDDLKKRFLS